MNLSSSFSFIQHEAHLSIIAFSAVGQSNLSNFCRVAVILRSHLLPSLFMQVVKVNTLTLAPCKEIQRFFGCLLLHARMKSPIVHRELIVHLQCCLLFESAQGTDRHGLLRAFILVGALFLYCCRLPSSTLQHVESIIWWWYPRYRMMNEVCSVLILLVKTKQIPRVIATANTLTRTHNSSVGFMYNAVQISI